MNTKAMIPPIEILLVDDNPGDIDLTLEAFQRARIANNIHVTKDGQEAIDYLTKKEEGFKKPDVILLDINLPKKNGHEVLEVIKSDDRLKHIPVIMLTTSESQDDIKRSYANHANCYISKPVVMSEFFKIVSTLEEFWLQIVKLPK